MLKKPLMPWSERISAISVNPGMATNRDIVTMAEELILLRDRAERAEKFDFKEYGFKTQEDFGKKINEWWAKGRPAIVWVWGGDKK